VQPVVILGATGSIGRQTAAVIAEHRDRLRAVGLAAHRDVDGMVAAVAALEPEWVVMQDREAAERVRARVGAEVRVAAGDAALLDAIAAVPPETAVVAAMSGFAGLKPTLAAAARGCRICLANKETLVAAGGLVRAAVARGGGLLLPVDSEHSALLQGLGFPPAPFRRLWLTCSGGPFRGWTREQLAHVTVEDALRHPVWRMGIKNTIDSATLMNKGLELIEALWLFDAKLDQVGVVIHPEGLIHSLVEFQDGSVLAQLAVPDMRIPIQLALSWPERWASPADRHWDLTRPWQFRLEPPDDTTFPALGIARQAAARGGTAPTVLNAANEVAVRRFVAGEIRYLDITALVGDVVERHRPEPVTSLEVVEAADAWARAAAESWRR
jgi:1-deoxy-D-xylulose-5-phosphate reductoisomerase